MKKVLIGCGIISLIIIVAVVGCGAYACHKLNQFGKSIEAAGQQIEALEKEFPFEAPADGLVSADRFNEYLDARDGILGAVMSVGFVSEMVAASQENRQPNVGFGDVMGIIGAIPTVMGDSAEALRSSQMSPKEFFFHSTVVLQWAKQAHDSGDPQLVEMWPKFADALDQVDAQMAANQDPNIRKFRQRPEDMLAMLDEAPTIDSNMALVESNRDRLMENQGAFLVEMIIAIYVFANTSTTAP